MIVIGERINGMFKIVGQAIREKDKAVIHDVALKQLEGGADFLDINVGTATDDPAVAMKWLVETVREVTNAPLSIDAPGFAAMRAGLEACSGEKMLNSTIGSDEALDKFLPLAVDNNAAVIVLSIDDKGVPVTTEGRCEIALRAVAKAMEYDIPMDKLFLDPIIIPVKAQQTGPAIVLEAIRQFKEVSDPAPHIVIGLSNLSQGSVDRKLINRTFLTMAVGAGCDAAIVDPLDTELMDAMIAAEMLMNRAIYTDSFLKAYRQRA